MAEPPYIFHAVVSRRVHGEIRQRGLCTARVSEEVEVWDQAPQTDIELIKQRLKLAEQMHKQGKGEK